MTPLRPASPQLARPGRALAGAAVCLLTLAGCSLADEQMGAADAAATFLTTAVHDPTAGCALLAPATRDELTDDGDGDCAAALTDAGLREGALAFGDVAVDGHTARVQIDEGAVFLALFDDGWRVTAAGCTRSGTDLSQPYDCAVTGG